MYPWQSLSLYKVDFFYFPPSSCPHCFPFHLHPPQPLLASLTKWLPKEAFNICLYLSPRKDGIILSSDVSSTFYLWKPRRSSLDLEGERRERVVLVRCTESFYQIHQGSPLTELLAPWQVILPPHCSPIPILSPHFHWRAAKPSRPAMKTEARGRTSFQKMGQFMSLDYRYQPAWSVLCGWGILGAAFKNKNISKFIVFETDIYLLSTGGHSFSTERFSWLWIEFWS